MSDLRGQCMCGAVRWSSAGLILRNLICHCTDCQKATSSPFTAFIGLPPDSIDWQGEVNHYQSSQGSHRGFCPKCGTRLYFRSDKWPHEFHIHATTLDDQASYQPDRHVVNASKAHWVELADDLPKHASFAAAPTEE